MILIIVVEFKHIEILKISVLQMFFGTNLYFII